MAGGFATQSASTTARVISASWFYNYPRPDWVGLHDSPPVRALQGFVLHSGYGNALEAVLREVVETGHLIDLETGGPLYFETSVTRSAVGSFECMLGIGRLPLQVDWNQVFFAGFVGANELTAEEDNRLLTQKSIYEETAKVRRRDLKKLAHCLAGRTPDEEP